MKRCYTCTCYCETFVAVTNDFIINFVLLCTLFSVISILKTKQFMISNINSETHIFFFDSISVLELIPFRSLVQIVTSIVIQTYILHVCTINFNDTLLSSLALPFTFFRSMFLSFIVFVYFNLLKLNTRDGYAKNIICIIQTE